MGISSMELLCANVSKWNYFSAGSEEHVVESGEDFFVAQFQSLQLHTVCRFSQNLIQQLCTMHNTKLRCLPTCFHIGEADPHILQFISFMSSFSKSPETNLMGQEGPGKYVFFSGFLKEVERLLIACVPPCHHRNERHTFCLIDFTVG